MRKKKSVPTVVKATNIIKMHEKKMSEFKSKNAQLKDVNIEINKLNNEIALLNKEFALNNINGKLLKCNEINVKKYYLEEKIKEYNISKEKIVSGENEINYIMSTCNIIRDYMEIEEEEKEYLNKDNQQDQDIQILNEINLKKRDLIDEYMKIIDPTYTTYRNLFDSSDSFCKECRVLLELKEGCGICPECGLCNTGVLHESDTLSWQQTQEFDFRPQFSYLRQSHLEDWLRRFTSKENKEIPQNIIDQVIIEAHKEKIKDLTTLDEAKVKKYLKKLELKDYYDNVITIINRINKRPAFVLTPDIEAKIKQMFNAIQGPYEKYKGKDRKSMGSYSYLLNKFFLILDLPEISKYFFLLKSPEKLRVQDEVFKKIVDELAKTDKTTNWRFFSSF